MDIEMNKDDVVGYVRPLPNYGRGHVKYNRPINEVVKGVHKINIARDNPQGDMGVALMRVKFCLNQLEKANMDYKPLNFRLDIADGLTLEELVEALVASEQILKEIHTFEKKLFDMAWNLRVGERLNCSILDTTKRYVEFGKVLR